MIACSFIPTTYMGTVSSNSFLIGDDAFAQSFAKQKHIRFLEKPAWVTYKCVRPQNNTQREDGKYDLFSFPVVYLVLKNS